MIFLLYYNLFRILNPIDTVKSGSISLRPLLAMWVFPEDARRLQATANEGQTTSSLDEMERRRAAHGLLYACLSVVHDRQALEIRDDEAWPARFGQPSAVVEQVPASDNLAVLLSQKRAQTTRLQHNCNLEVRWTRIDHSWEDTDTWVIRTQASSI